MRAFVVLLIATSCGNAGTQEKQESRASLEQPAMDQNRSQDVVGVYYSRSFGWFGSEGIEIAREGVSTMSLGFNHDGRPEIGIWQHPIAPARFDELVRRLRASGYDRLQTPPSEYPGAAPMSIGERRAGQTLPSLRDFTPDRAELKNVIAYLAELSNEVRQHPVRVLRGQARWRKPELSVRGTLELDVELTNAGVQPLEVANPLAEGGAELRLAFLRPDGEQVTQLSPGATDIVHAADTATTAKVSLAPDASLAFSIRTKVTVRAGRYKVLLDIVSSPIGDDEESISGTLQLDPGLVVVSQ